MVSTKTQIAGFEFDNCLMKCELLVRTIEELKETQQQELLVTKNSNLGISSGNP